MLTPFLGRIWDERGAQVGWIAPGTLATPDGLPPILHLLDRLEQTFQRNPRFENAEPEAKVTAAQAKAIHDDLERCIRGVGRVKSAQRASRRTWRCWRNSNSDARCWRSK